jgi:HAD superfamily hydrolase (TIGR01509 family)
MPPTRYVLFDVGGVLLRYKDEWLFERVARRSRRPREEIAATLRVLRNELQAGRLDERTLWVRFGRAVRSKAPRHWKGLWVQALRDRGQPNAELVSLAQQLEREGARVGIFSNTDASHVAYFRRRGWFARFRPWLLSYELKSVKPEAAAFLRARRRLGVPSSALLFVDDALANVQAARSLGWDAIQFRGVRVLRRELHRRGFLVASPTRR